MLVSTWNIRCVIDLFTQLLFIDLCAWVGFVAMTIIFVPLGMCDKLTDLHPWVQCSVFPGVSCYETAPVHPLANLYAHRLVRADYCVCGCVGFRLYSAFWGRLYIPEWARGHPAPCLRLHHFQFSSLRAEKRRQEEPHSPGQILY